jgi:hypothetical protein
MEKPSCPHLLQSFQSLEETRAWANFELVEILHQRGAGLVRFGRLRKQREKAWEDPGQFLLPAKPRLRKSRMDLAR